MPEFKANEAERQAKKAEELAPYVEAAFKRKEFMKELTDDEIETYRAYGFAVAEEDISASAGIAAAARAGDAENARGGAQQLRAGGRRQTT